MINELINVLKSIWRLLIWWFVVLPWEESLRIRAGKARRRFGPGLHFRIPYIDQVFKQSTRQRWTTLAAQTLTTKDGVTLTMAGQLGYRIVDVDKLYDTLHQGENALQSIGAGAIAKVVTARDRSECTPRAIEEAAAKALDMKRCGIEIDAFQMTTFCKVATVRLIQDSHQHIWDDLLDTRSDADLAKQR